MARLLRDDATHASSPSTTLKHLSFTHSAIYATLLIVWLVPGLHAAEFVFGLAHGIGWIVMSLLCIDAVRRRVISPAPGGRGRRDRRRRAVRRHRFEFVCESGAQPSTARYRQSR